MTESVHPTLEAVARAICIADGATGFSEDWRDYLPEARAALNALANEDPGLWGSRALREIAEGEP